MTPKPTPVPVPILFSPFRENRNRNRFGVGVKAVLKSKSSCSEQEQDAELERTRIRQAIALSSTDRPTKCWACGCRLSSKPGHRQHVICGKLACHRKRRAFVDKRVRHDLRPSLPQATHCWSCGKPIDTTERRGNRRIVCPTAKCGRKRAAFLERQRRAPEMMARSLMRHSAIRAVMRAVEADELNNLEIAMELGCSVYLVWQVRHEMREGRIA